MFNGHVNKRGSLEDLFVIGLFIFFFAMLILVGYKIIDSFNTEIQASEVLEQHGKDASAELTSFFPGVIDNSFLFFVVGLGLVTFVSAALVRVHPIFIGVYLVCLVFTIYFCGVFSNVYEAMASSSVLVGLSTNLVFVGSVMSFLPLIVGVFGSLLAIVMYKGWREAE